jgi:ubiquinone biosynthesis protein COQ9
MGNQTDRGQEPDSVVRARFLDAVAEHVPFDGWTRQAIDKAVDDLGLAPEQAAELPADGISALREWSMLLDRRAVEAASQEFEPTTRVRDKIILAVRRRLELMEPHAEAARRATVLLAIPVNALTSIRCLHHTVDAIWYAAGDAATDYNYYTKRGLLASVYGATLLYWLSDPSPGKANTWAFLERRIDDVMKIPGSLANLRGRFGGLQNPREVIDKLRRAQRWTYR